MDPRYHWYVNVTGAGPHLPGTAVRVRPTRAVPLIVGVGVGLNVDGADPMFVSPGSMRGHRPCGHVDDGGCRVRDSATVAPSLSRVQDPQ